MNNEQPPFQVFPKEDINKQFYDVIDSCKNLTSFEEIITRINKGFYNRLILSQVFSNKDPMLKVYRVTENYKDIDPTKISAFSYPPKTLTKQGRANIAGNPVFYCALDINTAIREMKDRLNLKDKFYISEWFIDFKEDVFVHPLLYNSVTSDESFDESFPVDDMNSLFKGKMFEPLTIDGQESIKQQLLRLGDLFTLKSEKNEDNNYNITSAYAHDILNVSHTEGTNISLMMYPSVANNHKGVNLAIRPDFVDSQMMSLSKVFELTFNSISDTDPFNVSISRKGISDGLNVSWKEPSVKYTHISWDKVELQTYSNMGIRSFDALELRIRNTLLTVSDLLNGSIEYSKYSMTIGGDKDLNPFEFTSREVSKLLYVKYTHGYKVKTSKGYSCIKQITVPVKYIEGFF